MSPLASWGGHGPLGPPLNPPVGPDEVPAELFKARGETVLDRMQRICVFSISQIITVCSPREHTILQSVIDLVRLCCGGLKLCAWIMNKTPCYCRESAMHWGPHPGPDSGPRPHRSPDPEYELASGL